MTRKNRRLMFGALGLSALFGATALVLLALQENMMFFRSPSDLANGSVNLERAIRLGGLVEPGSVVKSDGNAEVTFRITDGQASIQVDYRGILPDLFREGQGVIVEGRMSPSGQFAADEVLAKHDENYMPKEVADALKEGGHWKGEESATQ